MATDGESTADLIRAQLRRMRNAAGLSQEEFGRRAHFSPSMVSAVELGQRPLDDSYLARADEVLDTGGLFVRLLKLAKRDGEPLWFRPWLDAERRASQLRCFHPTLIPGLLQTANYARTLFRGDTSLTDDQVEELVAARLARQAILDRSDPPQFVAVIDESALNRFAEDCAEVMAEQLVHLLACAERPNISVHVIPRTVGLHIGLTGPFVLARSADGGWVGFMDNQLEGVAKDRVEDVATLLARWESVRNDALPRRQSIELIKELVRPWI